MARIIADLKQKNIEHPFVENFVKSEGYPLWQYAKFSSNCKNYKNTKLLDVNDGDSIVSVPVVLNDAQFVKDILDIKLNTEILYKLIRSENYASYGFDKNPDRVMPNADDIVSKFMVFEKEIWSQQIFKVFDNRLFDYWEPNAVKPLQFYVVAKFSSSVVSISYVCDFTSGGQLAGCTPEQEHGFGLVPVFCTANWYVSIWDNEDGAGGGRGTWEVGLPAMTGGGYGVTVVPGNPNVTPPNELPSNCIGGGAWSRIIFDEQSTQWKVSCTNEPVPFQPKITEPDPWVAPTMSTQDKDIFNLLNEEDNEIDNTNSNLDCKGTKRSGNIYFRGTLEHWLIQLDYISQDPVGGEREYKVPNVGYADIANELTNEMFEIKPDNPSGIAAGTDECKAYVAGAGLSCPPNFNAIIPFWHLGTSYNSGSPRYIPSANPYRVLVAEYISPGIIGYRYENRGSNIPLPVVVPQSVLEQLKELVDKIRQHLSDADAIISDYLKNHQGLVTYLKTGAVIAGASIIVGTIVEDFVTLGAGVMDDWASFVMAYRIIRFAWKLT